MKKVCSKYPHPNMCNHLAHLHRVQDLMLPNHNNVYDTALDGI